MNRSLIALVMFLHLTLTCDQNCYLGAGLYDSPLDAQGCCLSVNNDNCYSYISIGDGKFVCRQCDLYHKWDNDKCTRYPENEICINPDIKNNQFSQCKVCRLNGQKLIPVVKKGINNKEEISCQPVQKGAKEEALLNNCLASALHNGVVFCHLCADNYFYDGMAQKCMPDNKCETLKGCLLSFVENKCDLCREHLQFDMRNYSCISKSIKIDYEAFKSEMMNKLQNQMMTEQKLRADPNTAGFVNMMPNGMQGQGFQGGNQMGGFQQGNPGVDYSGFGQQPSFQQTQPVQSFQQTQPVQGFQGVNQIGTPGFQNANRMLSFGNNGVNQYQQRLSIPEVAQMQNFPNSFSGDSMIMPPTVY